MHTETEQSALTISLIVPTLNAGPEFKILLERLWNQTIRPKEIIVIDSSSTDSTVQYARDQGAKVYSIDQYNFDHGGTRNSAAAHASGDVLVFLTQDAVPADEGLLEQLIQPFDDLSVACAYARQIPKADANMPEQLSRSFNYPNLSIKKTQYDIPTMGIKTFFYSNVCAAVRRETFLQLGRFPEPVIFNEDLFFAAKCVLAGFSIAYVAEAKVVHSHNYTSKQQFKRFFDNGVSMRMNDWIYSYSSINKEGSRLLKSQLRELAVRREWKWIPALIAESAAKYLGYQLGKRYRYLPNYLCERFSMHRQIWEKMRSISHKGMSMKG